METQQQTLIESGLVSHVNKVKALLVTCCSSNWSHFELITLD